MQSIPTLDQEPVATKAKEGIRDKLPKVTNPETQRAASQNGEADYSVNQLSVRSLFASEARKKTRGA